MARTGGELMVDYGRGNGFNPSRRRGCRSHKRTSGVATIGVSDLNWLTG
jgi:hypothetical protein